MSSAAIRAGLRSRLLLATASPLLVLAGCGGSGETAGAAPAPAPPEEPDLKTIVEMEDDGTAQIVALTAPIEGPIENEPAVEKPLTTSFPEKEAPKRPSIELPAPDPMLGSALVVNGKIVPVEEIRKHVCLGTLGVPEVEKRKTVMFMEEEIQRRLAAGAQRSDVDVADPELDEYMRAIEEELRVEYPDLKLEDMLGGISVEESRGVMRLQRQFHKLFLPENPDELPPISVEAILKYPGGDAVLEQYRDGYRMREEAKKTAAAGGETDPELSRPDRALDEALLQQINEYLQSVSRIEREPAPGVIVRVNGKDITVDDVWKSLLEFVAPTDVLAAKQWIVNRTLLEEAFTAAGVWLTPEEAEAAYEAHSAPYRESLFSQESMAMTVKGFPSVDRYKEYRRLYESMHRMLRPQITPEVLDRHAKGRTNKIVGQVSVDVDVLLCSAFDFATQRWKPDGWVDAANRMRDVVNLLVEEQRPWEEMLERYSDFSTRPVLAGTDELTSKGLFRNIQRNNLLRELGESEYFSFLNGGTLTDFVFFELQVGTLGQPVRGPHGWYLPRLRRRSLPPARLPAREETLKTMILDDYLGTSLREYARDLVAKNEVYGLEIPGVSPELPK